MLLLNFEISSGVNRSLYDEPGLENIREMTISALGTDKLLKVVIAS